MELFKYNRTLNFEKWYKHQSESKGTTIQWDFDTQTDRKIKITRP